MFKRPPGHKFFILEGNIGAGKSTLLSLIKNNLDIEIIDEPLKKWQSMEGDQNLLDLFYKDTKRWAYTFQSYAFISRIQTIIEHYQKQDGKALKVLERSVYSDRFCFAKNCYENGLMTDAEWHIYKDWFDWLVSTYLQKPDGFIYLQTDPEISHARLTKRSRAEESAVPLEYLTQLHNKHEEWLTHQNDQPAYIQNIPILTLCCNRDFESDEVYRNQLLTQIQAFVANPAGIAANTPQSSCKNVQP